MKRVNAEPTPSYCYWDVFVVLLSWLGQLSFSKTKIHNVIAMGKTLTPRLEYNQLCVVLVFVFFVLYYCVIISFVNNCFILGIVD